METPASESAAPPESPTSSESPSEPGDRDAVAFLRRELLPALGSHASRSLREAVRRAIRDQRLNPLERLSGRHRHELLLAIEQLTESRRRWPPRVLVRLTTVVSATPTAPDLAGVSAVRPAR